MEPTLSRGAVLDRPANPPIRISFGLFWILDLVTTFFLFLVPYATELNPITTHFYNAIGFPGVFIAGAAYAGLVVMIGHYLSKPIDTLFATTALLVYAVCATNNVIVLTTGVSPLETLIA